MHTVSRLYETFHPTSYQLSLALERQTRCFSGLVTIAGEIKSPGTVKLHAKNLTIITATVNGEEAAIATEPDDILSLSTADGFPAGPATVVVEFAGRITDAMHGLYPCYYEHDGERKELLATQFESHHAREVFPCVDEPEAKATFDLTLTTEQDVTVLGNMPVAEQRSDNDRLITVFQTTPRMSSYLLAFVVGELQGKSATTKDGVTVTTWATKAQSPQSLDFGLDVAVRSIEFFNEYFGIAYPLPKADHVAIPDFSSGAMENWGLITYREVCLLADESSAISSREYIATVVAHETSHQWFGNLVTMRWWDDLWLNESFASLMEYVCVDALFPDWDIWMNFATQDVLSALRRDYLPGVQAVKTTVHHPDEISTLFDPSIVYAKGARTLAMCRAFIGDEAFRKGLREYFASHQYHNTTGDDLWKALGDASRKDVTSFMTPWIETPGLPRVHVSESEGALRLTQERFLIPRPAATDTEQAWPILLAANVESIPPLLDSSRLTTAAPTEVYYFNKNAVSHAVFHYDPDILTRIISHLANLPPVDRLSLLHDISLLSRAGHLSAVQLLDTLTAYKNENSQPVWDIISLAVNDLRRLVEDDEAAEQGLKRRLASLAQPLYERLGWHETNDEPEPDTKLRAVVIGLLGYAEYQPVVTQALEMFREADDISSLPGELRPVVFSLVAKHGDGADIDRLWRSYTTTSNSELQSDITEGLTSTTDPQLIEQFLSILTDRQKVRQQDLRHWFARLMRNRHSRDATWQWMVENWQWIENTFGGDKSYDDFARYSAAALGTDAWLERYHSFFADKRLVPALTRAVDLGVADIRVRADWHRRDAEMLRAALSLT